MKAKKERKGTTYLAKKYVEKDFLPQAWKTNGRSYVSSNGKYLNTLQKAIKEMQREGYSEKDIDKVKMFGSKLPYKKTSSLPEGWMFAALESKDMKGGPVEFTRFLSSDGHSLQSRATAIQFMIENNHSPSDIERMKSLLVTEDNWKMDPQLPEGWMKKELKASPPVYLSPTYELFKFKVHVIEFMKKQGYSQQVIQKTEKHLYEKRHSLSVKRELNIEDNESPTAKKPLLHSEVVEWKSGDSSLPENWLIATKGSLQ